MYPAAHSHWVGEVAPAETVRVVCMWVMCCEGTSLSHGHTHRRWQTETLTSHRRRKTETGSGRPRARVDVVGGQELHVVAPIAFEYVPIGHAGQIVLEAEALKVPAWQSVQLAVCIHLHESLSHIGGDIAYGCVTHTLA